METSECIAGWRTCYERKKLQRIEDCSKIEPVGWKVLSPIPTQPPVTPGQDLYQPPCF